jgi:hypothetical protein
MHAGPGKTVKLELEVLSESPRVFKISNFVAPDEVEHLLQLGDKVFVLLAPAR